MEVDKPCKGEFGFSMLWWLIGNPMFESLSLSRSFYVMDMNVWMYGMLPLMLETSADTHTHDITKWSVYIVKI